MSNADTKLNHTTINTELNDEMKNAMRWESLLNALLTDFLDGTSFQINQLTTVTVTNIVNHIVTVTGFGYG